MLNSEQYEKIIEFQQKNAGIITDNVEKEIYAKKILRILDSVFGIRHSFCGYLGNCDTKYFSPNGPLYGINSSFFQQFLALLWEEKEIKKDFLAVDEIPDYKKSPLYKNVLRKNEYEDCLVMFCRRSNGKYISWLCMFSEKIFSEEEKEMLWRLKDTIGINYENFLKVWNIKNDIKMLQNQSAYYPLGIMIVENTNNVTYTNALAKKYLSELGYEDARFYGIFFVNELYPYIQYDMTTFGNSKSIRIGSFLFNLQSIGNPGKNFDKAGQPLVPDMVRMGAGNRNDLHYNDTSLCVYIVKDTTAAPVVSKKTLREYGLTKRECQVAELIIEGMSNQNIAKELVISLNTVKIHVSKIFSKLNVKSRTEMIDCLFKRKNDGVEEEL